MARRRGFTLVELLVVIGVIAVLVTLLMPGLNRARELANRVRCQSNVGQLMKAVLAYAGDNDGALPNPNWAPHEVLPPVAAGWLYAPPLAVPGDPAQAETGSLWPYVLNRAVYRCPMDDAGSAGSCPVHAMTSYLMNAAVIAYGARQAPFPLRQMRGGDVCFWEAGEDEPGYFYPSSSWTDGSSYPPEGFTVRHQRGANVACFDGHAEYVPNDEYVAESNDVNRNRLWCVPTTWNGH